VTDNNFLWYVASPYSDPSPSIMNHRYRLTMQACANLTAEGYFVISPILHWHETATQFGIPTDCEFWESYNRTLMEVCDGIIILMIDGWKKSKGVAKELAWAQGLGLEVKHVYG
jgi:hypothetical protein